MRSMVSAMTTRKKPAAQPRNSQARNPLTGEHEDGEVAEGDAVAAAGNREIRLHDLLAMTLWRRSGRKRAALPETKRQKISKLLISNP